MTDIEVAIGLIVPDNTAYTALTALRQLDYRSLERVERAEIYSVDADVQPRDAPQVVRKITHAEVLYNPSTHRLSYAVEIPVSDSAAADRPEGWEALVTDRDDDTTGLVRLLKGPFGLGELRTLTRRVAWRLYETDGPASRERHEWACRELLANPFSQTFVVRAAPAMRSVEGKLIR